MIETSLFTLQPIDLLVSALMIAGTLMVAQRRPLGWWLFLATNVVLIGIAWELQRWGQLPGYVVLCGINLYGLVKWRAPKPLPRRMVTEPSNLRFSDRRIYETQ